MFGLMQSQPLLISSILMHAACNHRGATVTSAWTDGSYARHSYPRIADRASQLASALVRHGVKQGDRIATIAWNDHRHLELYYGVSGMGAICHTINPRLFPDQIICIIRHAADSWIFVDATLIKLVEGIIEHVKDMVKGVVVMGASTPETPLSSQTTVIGYEDFIGAEATGYDWPQFDENTASSLCYTTGTTGNPKGVLYSHRSTVLHGWSILTADAMGIRAQDCVLPVVPMFHVNAWGTPYGALMVGASLAMPGPRLDGPSLEKLIKDAGVTYAAGVPTVWMGLLQHLKTSGAKLPPGMRMVIGGSAVPRMLIEEFKADHDARIDHAWGMTEMSPIGTYFAIKPENKHLEGEAFVELALKQGRNPFGVRMKIVDDDDEELPWDGGTFGELLVKGPWVASSYYQDDEQSDRFTADGWFRTGDVASIDPEGYLTIVDRAKDVIKSGGEWISSIELENIAVGHPKVKEAAVIPANHPKWDERPLLLVVPSDDGAPTMDEMVAFYGGKVAKWMIPDDMLVVDNLPHTATGKLLKRQLKLDYGNHFMKRNEA